MSGFLPEFRLSMPSSLIKQAGCQFVSLGQIVTHSPFRFPAKPSNRLNPSHLPTILPKNLKLTYNSSEALLPPTSNPPSLQCIATALPAMDLHCNRLQILQRMQACHRRVTCCERSATHQKTKKKFNNQATQVHNPPKTVYAVKKSDTCNGTPPFSHFRRRKFFSVKSFSMLSQGLGFQVSMLR